ncbi:DUF365 domain-containing protein [Candidatus Bathyarchaeota archaeon]|nr:DUF365 domain-containing protein [Candidatus Bathyarchaeota archaeon]
MSQEYSDKIVGAVFPILPEHVSNLFDKKRSVYVKFTWMDLAPGSTIVFYASRLKILIGEAKVFATKKLDPQVALSLYAEKLYIDEKDYEQYSRVSSISQTARKMTEITIFELNSLKRYKTPVKPVLTMTPSGRYLTKDLLQKIRYLSQQE